MSKNQTETNLLLILSFLALCAIASATVYRVYALNYPGVFAALAAAVFLFYRLKNIFLGHPFFAPAEAEAGTGGRPEPKNAVRLTIFFYFLLAAGCLYLLFAARTGAALVSPWEAVPVSFFFYYAAASLLLIFLIARPIHHSLLLLAFHFGLSLSIALAVYKNGYGFDPLIHEATLDLIDRHGAVDPKPFYYLGQYGLIMMAHKLLFLPIDWQNRLLVPALAVIFLPLSFYLAASQGDRQKSGLAALACLALPCAIFTLTTPQNLSYLFFLLAILFAWPAKRRSDLALPAVFSLAAASVHPIAGIPAVLLILLSAAAKLDAVKIKKGAVVAVLFFSAVALPLSFYFLENNNAGDTGEKIARMTAWQATREFAASLRPAMPASENFILNAAYLYAFNLKIAFILLAAAGLFLYFRRKTRQEEEKLFLAMAATLLVSHLLIKTLPFEFLVSYERDAYADRILILIAVLLLPSILAALAALAGKIMAESGRTKIIFAVFAALAFAASLYASYPRRDALFNSRGYSVGDADFAAAEFIDKNAAGEFLVLANQQTSAAALKNFGFKKYYKNGSIFYYPIPTGGPLYPFYLDMVYKKASRETMAAAMDLAGVKESYFVLNKYWWAFSKVLDEARLEADDWWEIGNGDIYVFKYKR